MSPIVCLRANSLSERLYFAFRLIWAGWVFLVNGHVVLDFSPKHERDDFET